MSLTLVLFYQQQHVVNQNLNIQHVFGLTKVDLIVLYDRKQTNKRTNERRTRKDKDDLNVYFVLKREVHKDIGKEG